jgi:hypothetical protein
VTEIVEIRLYGARQGCYRKASVRHSVNCCALKIPIDALPSSRR